MENMAPRSPWLIVITGLFLILGCAESAAAQFHTYAIHPNVTETGASTWNPSFVMIDMDKLDSRSPLVFHVTNSSSEDLGIHAHLPAFGEVTVRSNITAPGVYEYYSDRHPRTSAPTRKASTRPHVPEWLVIREAAPSGCWSWAVESCGSETRRSQKKTTRSIDNNGSFVAHVSLVSQGG